jgi:hypothetical protein
MRCASRRKGSDLREAETTLDEKQLRLDGNAAAGLLSEVFAQEVTGARSACGSCGTVAEVGSQHLYMYRLAPGAVLRCNACDCVLIVMVRGEGWFRLGLEGLAWLEMRAPVEGSG